MAIPEGNHTDWVFPLSLIPRTWTAIPDSVPPVKIAGSAPTAIEGWHFRLGTFRFDVVDGYYQIPTATIKKIKFPASV